MRLAGVVLLVLLVRPPAQATPTGQICALAWDDANRNGVHDPGENPQLGVNISLMVKDTIVIANHLSDGTGQYCFSNLVPGEYTLGFASPLVEPTTGASFKIGVNAGDQVVREFGSSVLALTVSATASSKPPITTTARLALSAAGAIFAMLFMVGLGLMLRNFYGIVARR